MTEDDVRQMIDTVTASTFANKAILACMVAGVPVTEENCALAAAPWLNPESAHAERLALAMLGHIKAVIGAAGRLSPSASRH